MRSPLDEGKGRSFIGFANAIARIVGMVVRAILGCANAIAQIVGMAYAIAPWFGYGIAPDDEEKGRSLVGFG